MNGQTFSQNPCKQEKSHRHQKLGFGQNTALSASTAARSVVFWISAFLFYSASFPIQILTYSDASTQPVNQFHMWIDGFCFTPI